MRSEWKPGDLVRLKSGGPLMTVQRKTCQKTNEYRCSWFDETVIMRSTVFQGEALQPASIEMDRKSS